MGITCRPIDSDVADSATAPAADTALLDTLGAMMPEPPIGERRPPQFTLVELLVVMAVAALLLALLAPWLGSAWEDERRAQCTDCMKLIALSLHNYHDVWNVFPPAQTLDRQNRPMHGWRILVERHIEKGPYYDRYQFQQAWDGPANLPLHAVERVVYACPSDSSRLSTTVSYLAIIGDKTAWPRQNSTTVAEIRDGTSNTLLVVEAANSGIHWLEPRDLEFDNFDYAINSGSGRGIRSGHSGGANVLYVDGAVGWLSESTPPGLLRALLTIAGGENMPADWTR